MTEIKLDHSEFVKRYEDNSVVPWVDVNKGHALMKSPFAPYWWRVSVRYGTYVALLLMPMAVIFFFFTKWWIPAIMISLAFVMIKLIRTRSQKAVIATSLSDMQFYEIAVSTDTLRIYRLSTKADIDQGNTHTAIVKQGLNAQTIINTYTEALAKGSSGTARPISYLVNSKDEIKQAYKDYIKALKQRGKLDDRLLDQLRLTYSEIDHFIDDEIAEIVNRVTEQTKMNQPSDENEENIYMGFRAAVLMNSTKKMTEFDELINDERTL